MGALGIGVYHGSEHLGRILGAEVDNVAPNAGWIDLGGVDFNNGNILCVLVGVGAGDDGGEDDMAKDMAFVDRSAHLKLLPEGGETLCLLLCFFQLLPGTVPLCFSQTTPPPAHSRYLPWYSMKMFCPLILSPMETRCC